MSARQAPLYQGAMATAAQHFTPTGNKDRPIWAGNTGLWYDKFCDRWDSGFGDISAISKTEENPKLQWVDSVIFPRRADGVPDRTEPAVRAGDPDLLVETAKRREALARAQGGLCLEFILETRLLTGTGRPHPVENGIAWHPTLGVPFLAGSGVKGVLRSWARQAADATPDLIDTLFGPPSDEKLHVGALQVLDALPVEPVLLAAEIITPHTGPWNQVEPDAKRVQNLDDAPADWHSPVPVPLLAVESDIRFQFILLPGTGPVPKGGWEATLARCQQWLTDALHDLGAGAKTSSGYGRFRAVGAPGPTDPDISLPRGVRPSGKPATAGQAATTTALPRHGTVDGEAVEILRREGSHYVVKFIDSGDIERVRIEEVNFK
ncbi:type III-B CRISPR module RAMP protein Cmr6 [Niveispirillum irakense]|uniref:type III-B CRISPR module RAMP protein Cmr6 n=1 Tax=Niveispirillum irakense TaxID=34011 RepID=UPI0003FD6192|nr:type III-B CRISPR module RAMP protein Cmr6 [Niveispirillum irakense]